MRYLFSLMILISLMLSNAYADVRGSSDPEGLERYPGSMIVKYRDQSVDNYRWVLGALEKVNGRLAFERSERLSGRLIRTSYRVPEGVGPEEAYQWYVDRFKVLGAKPEFSCSGRECGSSNEWANKVFRYAKLYGIERTQHYGAWQWAGKKLAVYAVQRGNRKVYLHVDLVQSKDRDYSQELDDNGYIEIKLTADWLDERLKTYLLSSQQSFWLVVHSKIPSGGVMVDSLSHSTQIADSVRKRLIALGMNEAKVNSRGVGALMPEIKVNSSDLLHIIQTE